MWWLKFNFSSRYTLTCFWWLVCATGMPLKVGGIWLTLPIFSRKDYFLSLFRYSRIEDRFPLMSPHSYFPKIIAELHEKKLEL